MELMKANSVRLSIHNRRCQQTVRNMRGLPRRQIHRIKRSSRSFTRMYGVPSLPRAAQTVFGGGPKNAPIMLVGEQPGDYEDVAGKPFVGPAGKIMDRAVEEAGIDRSLPPMARGGNASCEGSTRRLSRIDRGPDGFRVIVA